MSRNEITDLLIDELQKYGLEGVIEDRGKHLGVVFDTPSGRKTIFTSRTPSDWRTGLNSRSQLRQLLREENIQPKVEQVFHRAMSLPKPPVLTYEAREKAYIKDIETLTDFVFELQDRLTSLQDKMQSATVVSRIEFGTQSVEVKQEVAPTNVIKFQPKKEKGPWTPKIGTVQYNVLCMVQERLMTTQEIVEKSGLKYKNANTVLGKLKSAGLLENPRRGYWRRRPDGSSALLGS